MSKHKASRDSLNEAYKGLVASGVIHEGTPEEQAAEDAALRKKWVNYESEDPLWMDLARVAARVLQGEFPDISLEMCAFFIRSLPARIQWQISLTWRESGEKNQQLIARGCLQEFADKNPYLKLATMQKGDHPYQGPTRVGDKTIAVLQMSGGWAEKPPKG